MEATASALRRSRLSKESLLFTCYFDYMAIKMTRRPLCCILKQIPLDRVFQFFWFSDKSCIRFALFIYFLVLWWFETNLTLIINSCIVQKLAIFPLFPPNFKNNFIVIFWHFLFMHNQMDRVIMV